MTLVYDSRRLTAALLAIALLLVAFVWACPVSAHAETAAAADSCCPVAGHASGLVPALGREAREIVVPPSVAWMPASPRVPDPIPVACASSRLAGAWHGAPADPLNGRLRL